MNNTYIFETIMEQNKKYADMIKNDAPAVVQEIQLEICSTLFESLILKGGLINEYDEYCKNH